MPITYRIDAGARLVRTVATGVVIDDDLCGHEDRLAADPGFETGMDQIVDGRAIERLEVSSDGVRTFVAHETNRYAQRFAGHRVAIIATENVVFGMSRMYQTLSQVNVGVFRTMREALSFLGRGNEEP